MSEKITKTDEEWKEELSPDEYEADLSDTTVLRDGDFHLWSSVEV